jgi:hypothetical protein
LVAASDLVGLNHLRSLCLSVIERWDLFLAFGNRTAQSVEVYKLVSVRTPNCPFQITLFGGKAMEGRSEAATEKRVSREIR